MSRARTIVLVLIAVFLVIVLLFALRGCRRRSVGQVPPPFQNLLTDTKDYTCTGSVPCVSWPMPPAPAPGSSYTDSTWGTTIWRLATVPQNTAGNGCPVYARVQSWNSDGTLLMVGCDGVYADLYDATKTPPAPINRITTTDGSIVDPMDRDALWANTDPHRLYYVAGYSSSVGHGTELRYVDVSACTVQNCVLEPQVVHTFSCMSDGTESDIAAGIQGNQIETGSGGQGGMFDSTDRYFSFTCDYVNGTGRHEIDFVHYDRTTDQVTAQMKWYKVCSGQVPTGCAVWSISKLRKNLIRMNQHPDSRFITVIWQCGARDYNWARGCGVEAFDPAYNYIGVVSPYPGHQDNGFDVNGVPVFVGVGSFRNDPKDQRAISITDLTHLSLTAQTYKRILLPCSYSRQPGCDTGTSLSAKSGASHVSMVGTWGAFPGWAAFSSMILAGGTSAYNVDYAPGVALGTEVGAPGTVTVTPASMSGIAPGVVSLVGFGTPTKESVTWSATTATTATAVFAKTHAADAMVSCLSCGDTGFGAMENLAVKIDTTAADGSDAVFYRIGRAFSLRGACYNCEPHTTVARDWSQILEGSNWNTDGLSSSTPVSAYWTRLAASVPIPPNPVTAQCSLKLDSTGKVIEELHCQNLPLVNETRKPAAAPAMK